MYITMHGYGKKRAQHTRLSRSHSFSRVKPLLLSKCVGSCLLQSLSFKMRAVKGTKQIVVLVINTSMFHNHFEIWLKQKDHCTFVRIFLSQKFIDHQKGSRYWKIFSPICRSEVLNWATQALILSQKMKGKRLFCFLQPNYYFFSSFLAWSKLVIKKSPHAKGLGCACAHPLTTADTYKSILILAYHFRTPDAANDFSLASLKSCLGFTASIFGG